MILKNNTEEVAQILKGWSSAARARNRENKAVLYERLSCQFSQGLPISSDDFTALAIFVVDKERTLDTLVQIGETKVSGSCCIYMKKYEVGVVRTAITELMYVRDIALYRKATWFSSSKRGKRTL